MRVRPSLLFFALQWLVQGKGPPYGSVTIHELTEMTDACLWCSPYVSRAWSRYYMVSLSILRQMFFVASSSSRMSLDESDEMVLQQH